MEIERLIKEIFDIRDKKSFDKCCLEVFRFQSEKNPIYKTFVSHLRLDPLKVNDIEHIPFLPVSLFKTQKIITEDKNFPLVFKSSGTTGMTERSHHYIADP